MENRIEPLGDATAAAPEPAPAPTAAQAPVPSANPQVFTMDPLPQQPAADPEASILTQTRVTPTPPSSNSIYPTAEPPMAPSLSGSVPNTTWSPETTAAFKSYNSSSLSFILGLVTFAIVPLLIFFPRLISSTTLLIVWIVAILLLGGAGVYFGRQGWKGGNTDFKNFVGVILSVFMLLFAIIAGCYYIKIQMTINSFKNSYSNYEITN